MHNVEKKGRKLFTGRRYWDPHRSKLAAFILKGADHVPIKKEDVVLYLGASSGTTASHVADCVKLVFALEFSPIMMRRLFYLCKSYSNMAPILADANNIDSYKSRVPIVDFIYQDIAQRNQVDIFLRNCDAFLKKGGFCILCVKARSIDVIKKPKDVFKEVMKQLSEKLEIVNHKTIEPFQLDHCVFLCKKTKNN